ncbi:uncharacterized protein METZ01_LOCUS266330, partial [marine metagenome]
KSALFFSSDHFLHHFPGSDLESG